MAQDNTSPIVIYQGDGSNNVFDVPFDKGYYGTIKVSFVRRGLDNYTYNPTTYTVSGNLYCWKNSTTYYYTDSATPSVGATVYNADGTATEYTVTAVAGSTVTINNVIYSRSSTDDKESNSQVTWTGTVLNVGDYICIVRETTNSQPFSYPNNQKHIEKALDNLERQIQEVKASSDKSLQIDTSKGTTNAWLKTVVRSTDLSLRGLRYNNGHIQYSFDDPEKAEASKTWYNLSLSFSEITGQPTDNANLATALNAKADASTVTSHINNVNNPHSVTKGQVGLGNCDNTSDLNKPISTATQTALDAKQNTLTAGDNITITGNTISATDTTYTAGNGISLTGTQFSADTSVLATKTELNTKQDILTAGSNIQINGTTISATDTTYTAGTNISIENGVISATGSGAEYTAGVGIDINNNVISANGVKNQNDTTTAIKEWVGYKTDYEALTSYDDNTLYFIIETIIREITGYPINVVNAIVGNLINYKLYGESKQEYITIDGVQYKVPSGYTVLDYIESNSTNHILLTDFSITSPFTKVEIIADVSLSQVTTSRQFCWGFGGDLVAHYVEVDATGKWGVGSGSTGTAVTCTVGQTYHIRQETTAEKNTLYVDNAETVSITTYQSATDVSPIVLYGLLTTTTYYGRYVQLHNWKLVADDVVKCVLIPVKDSSNNIGVYNLITNTFTSVTSTEFIAGNEAPCPAQPIDVLSVGDKNYAIPYETYTPVEYIESSGTQYINTGINASSGLSVETDIQWTDTTSTQHVFGGRIDSSHKFGVAIYQSKWDLTIGSDIFTTTAVTSDKTNIKFNTSSSGASLSIDDTEIKTTTTTVSQTINMWLFANNNNGSINLPASLKMYNCKIYDSSNVLVRNYIPVLRKSDSVYGMYDTVTQTFYSNSGTGSFTGGSARTDLYKLPVVVGSNCGIVDLGTKNISYSTSGTPYFSLSISEITASDQNVYIYGYTQTTDWNTFWNGDKLILSRRNGIVYMKNNAYTNANALKASLGYMFYKRTTDTSWTAPTVTTTYLSAPLRKIGSYSDYIDYENQQVVRNIGVKVLDGTESWSWTSVRNALNITDALVNTSAINYTVLCNDYLGYEGSVSVSSMSDNSCKMNASSTTLLVKDATHSTDATTWTTYLASQYSAGTPVIVYYPLATATTESITIPAITMSQGTNIVTTGTTVTPSSGYAKWEASE